MYQSNDLKRICRNVASIIEDELSRVGLFFKVFSRVKESDSADAKISHRGEGYYNETNKRMQDIIGIRVILYFSDDLGIVNKGLRDLFEFVDETKDENEETRFAPTRENLIFRLPSDLIPEFSDILKSKLFDTTFEVQLRTILSEGWHEVDHDLRYKCEDDWQNNSDLSRSFNGILATLETSEYSILRLFDQLSYRHYKSNNLAALMRTKFRLRFLSDGFSKALMKQLSPEIIKDIYKLDRIEAINSILKSKILIPVTMENLIYILNHFYLKNESIVSITPAELTKELH